MKLYIWESDVDDDGYFNEGTLVDTIEGESSEDCERKASEKYSDTEIYAWSYLKPRDQLGH